MVSTERALVSVHVWVVEHELDLAFVTGGSVGWRGDKTEFQFPKWEPPLV